MAVRFGTPDEGGSAIEPAIERRKLEALKLFQGTANKYCEYNTLTANKYWVELSTINY